jgi:elongation factor P hydroxylase
MKTVRGIAKAITGKQVTPVDYPEYYFIGPNHLEIPGGKGKKEQALHEVLHWVIAEDWQREHPDNLGYGHSQDDYEGKDPRCTARMMERQELMTCHAQRILYQFAGKPFPTYGSCTFNGRDRALTDAEIAWVVARCTEAGWDALVGMARARW